MRSKLTFLTKLGIYFLNILVNQHLLYNEFVIRTIGRLKISLSLTVSLYRSLLSMAAKVVLSWSPHQHQHQHQNGPSFPSRNPSKLVQAARDVTQQKQPRGRSSAKKRLVVVRASLPESLMSCSPAPLLHTPSTSLFLLAADTAGYSLASYYTSLGLFVISVPGLWSLIKRSVKSKVSNSLSIPFISYCP